MRAGRASLHEGCLVGWCSHCKCLFSPKLVPPRPSWPHRKVLRLPLSGLCGAGARSARGKTQQGGAQKVSPGANVFSWKFCTRTSRSRQLNRYGWRAMGLQRWVGWGEGTEGFGPGGIHHAAGTNRK